MFIRNIEKPDEEYEQFKDAVFENLPPVSDFLERDISSLIMDAMIPSNLDWTVGHPCPECGSEKLTRLRTTTEQIKSDNGNTSLQKTSPHVDDLVWWCSECEETLRLHPAMNFSKSPREGEGVLLPISINDYCYPETPVGELLEVLEEKTRLDTSWSKGEPCTECGSTHLIQISVDTEYMIGNGNTALATGDRIGVLRYQCVNCRVFLDRHLVEPLVPEITG